MVRQRFEDAGVTYPAEIIDARREAAIYLLPRWIGDSAVRWWETKSSPLQLTLFEHDDLRLADERSAARRQITRKLTHGRCLAH